MKKENWSTLEYCQRVAKKAGLELEHRAQGKDFYGLFENNEKCILMSAQLSHIYYYLRGLEDGWTRNKRSAT